MPPDDEMMMTEIQPGMPKVSKWTIFAGWMLFPIVHPDSRSLKHSRYEEEEKIINHNKAIYTIG